MTWLKLDDKFAGHPKISPLSHGAFRLHVAGMLYAAQHETDGRIPLEIVSTLIPGYRRGFLVELGDHGLWEPNGGKAFDIHDFTEYNPSREQMQAKRAATKKRVEEWRKKRNEDGDDDDAVTDGVTRPPTGL